MTDMIEKAVLGAMLIENECIPKVIDILGEDHAWEDGRHEVIYGAILDLVEKKSPVDQVSVSEWICNEGGVEVFRKEAGGATYIARLASEMFSAVNAEFHANCLLGKK